MQTCTPFSGFCDQSYSYSSRVNPSSIKSHCPGQIRRSAKFNSRDLTNKAGRASFMSLALSPWTVPKDATCCCGVFARDAGLLNFKPLWSCSQGGCNTAERDQAPPQTQTYSGSALLRKAPDGCEVIVQPGSTRLQLLQDFN